MANNNNFNWVKPYNNNGSEITSGEGYLSNSEGFPVNWKLENSNFGRLKRRATYQFTTNNIVFTGEGNRSYITRTATLQQHGQPIFDIENFDQAVSDNTIVFNLADSTQPSGVISISNAAYTNAQYLQIIISPDTSGNTWSQGQDHTFTQVSWATDNTSNLYLHYFNGVRENTKYRFIAGRPAFYGSQGTYQENDFDDSIRSSYMFKMVYQNGNTKISTGSERDIEEYFGSSIGVTPIDFNSLNSEQLQFTDNNGETRTFKEYYNNLLTAGETNKFSFLFYTDVNSEIKSEHVFDLFTNSESEYYIGTTEMLHFTITIKPYGYKQKLDDIQQQSPTWSYEQTVIDVYIINCQLNPYLYLNEDENEQDYISSVLQANGETKEMPVFSNRGWDITTQGDTEYFGYDS